MFGATDFTALSLLAQLHIHECPRGHRVASGDWRNHYNPHGLHFLCRECGLILVQVQCPDDCLRGRIPS